MVSHTSLVAVLMAVMGLAACDSGATAVQLEWCANNQAKVGRFALENGLMPAGTDFTQWKQTYPVEYETACIGAFGQG